MLLPKIQRSKVESKSQLLGAEMIRLGLLLPKIQRSKVESKSQHADRINSMVISCYQKYKDQKLKANHNL